jgi:hypothetical protein
MSARFRSFGLDLFPFLGVVLMAAGVLIVALVSNLLAVLESPDHVRITSIIRSSGVGAQAGEAKQPSRVEVYRDHLVIYPDEVVVAVRDLDREGDAFKKLLDDVSAEKESRYILLMARPGSATVVNLLKKRIRACGVDVGCELYEAGRPAEFERVAGAAGGKQAMR